MRDELCRGRISGSRSDSRRPQRRRDEPVRRSSRRQSRDACRAALVSSVSSSYRWPARTSGALGLRAPTRSDDPTQTATLETEICGQRLSAARAANGGRRRPERLSRPTDAAASRGNVGLFCSVGNHVDLRRLPGGAEGNRTPDLCSAIAALSHLSYSPVARLFTCASDACQRHRRGGSGRIRFNGSLLKGWKNSCVRFSTS
jgi:hypothetical protein